jgi:23S rRNA (cytosine1962-C5)-methyltransferase
MDDLQEILDPEFSFVLLSSHSAGYTPIAIRNILIDFAGSETDVRYSEGEMLVAEGNGKRFLPSGAYCFLARDSIEDML